jgi:hypothetical protein
MRVTVLSFHDPSPGPLRRVRRGAVPRNGTSRQSLSASRSRLFPRQGVGRAVIQLSYASAASTSVFGFQHSSTQKLSRHLFDSKANGFCGGVKPSITRCPLTSFATGWKQLGRLVVIEL